MKETTVPIKTIPEPVQVLQYLTESLPNLTPELQKTAAYVLENPNEIGVSSIREIAAKAKVKPNSLVRMAELNCASGSSGSSVADNLQCELKFLSLCGL